MTLAVDHRIAVITGITGQDGSYLAELLLSKGYEVHGVVRDLRRLGNIAHLRDRIHLHSIDLSSQLDVCRLVEEVEPDEYYHLAAPTFIPYSLEQPLEASREIAFTVVVALEAIRQTGNRTRFVQAGSSEMFGLVEKAPQNEWTPFRPRNPYASAKVFAHNLVNNYRDHFGVFACNGILFNHESPRRGVDFVTRKISLAVARIKLHMQNELVLGSLDAQRDWGFAGDFVRAYWTMLQQEEARDYVIGTGVLTSVQQVVEYAFERVQLDWRDYVRVDARFVRPAASVPHVADISRARNFLGWEPSVPIRELVSMMVDEDLRNIERTLTRRAA